VTAGAVMLGVAFGQQVREGESAKRRGARRPTRRRVVSVLELRGCGGGGCGWQVGIGSGICGKMTG
jgi:hypothetical protein